MGWDWSALNLSDDGRPATQGTWVSPGYLLFAFKVQSCVKTQSRRSRKGGKPGVHIERSGQLQTNLGSKPSSAT